MLIYFVPYLFNDASLVNSETLLVVAQFLRSCFDSDAVVDAAVGAVVMLVVVAIVVVAAVTLPLLALPSPLCCFGDRIAVVTMLDLSSMEHAVFTVGVAIVVRGCCTYKRFVRFILR